jgi:formylmethanofuran dehydrogenase subunit E
MVTFETVNMVTCSGCGKRLPKSLTQGVGNQRVCRECMSIWEVD